MSLKEENQDFNLSSINSNTELTRKRNHTKSGDVFTTRLTNAKLNFILR